MLHTPCASNVLWQALSFSGCLKSLDMTQRHCGRGRPRSKLVSGCLKPCETQS
ncbi:hypothetical protein ACKLNO_11590 [Neisseriaceae bacterium B1]